MGDRRPYATDTDVPADRTIAQIKDFLRKGRAVDVASEEGDHGGAIRFTVSGRRYTFRVVYASLNDDRFQLTPTGKWRRTPAEAYKVWSQDCRARWRAVMMLVRYKWMVVEQGLAPFHREFLPYLLVEDGADFGDLVEPLVVRSLRAGVLVMNAAQPAIALPAAVGMGRA